MRVPLLWTEKGPPPRSLEPRLPLPFQRGEETRHELCRNRLGLRSAPRLATGSSACSPSSGCGSPLRGSESPTRSSCSSGGVFRRSGEPRSPSYSSWRRRWTAGSSPLDRELAPLARADERARLLATMPGIGPLLGLTFAAEIGEVSRFRSPGKLIAYAGLAPRVSQSGERSQTGALSKAGSR